VEGAGLEGVLARPPTARLVEAATGAAARPAPPLTPVAGACTVKLGAPVRILTRATDGDPTVAAVAAAAAAAAATAGPLQVANAAGDRFLLPPDGAAAWVYRTRDALVRARGVAALQLY